MRYTNMIKTMVCSLVFFSYLSGYSIQLDSLGREITEYLWFFHPVSATYQGIHRYDTSLTDYRPAAWRTRLADIRNYSKRLDAIDTLLLSTDENIDYVLLKTSLLSEIFNIEKIKTYQRNPLVYAGEAINGIYYLLIRSSPSTGQKIEAIKKRFLKIPNLFDQARENLMSPAPIFCEIAIEQLKEGAEFYNEVAKTYEDSLDPAARKAFSDAKDRAVVALAAFRFWLEDKVTQSARSFALGREDYEYKLRRLHLLDMSADSILALGNNMLTWTTKMIDSIKVVYRPPQLPTLLSPDSFGRQGVLNYRQWEIGTMRRFVDSANIVSVPDWVGDLVVVETPRFLRGLIPGIAMEPPGPFDKSTTSYFYSRPIAEKFDSVEKVKYYNMVVHRGFKGSVVHEGYPGHHLQLSIANHHPSMVRRNYSDFFPIEGWALYCEEMMSETGLYQDTTGAILGWLGGVKFRAVRVIVDVKLQTEQFDCDQAINFMYKALGGDTGDSIFYAKEIKRYITDPAQASSYLVGKMQILRLREEYRQLKGPGFSLKEFHDWLLSQGSIPLTLVRRRLMAGAD